MENQELNLSSESNKGTKYFLFSISILLAIALLVCVFFGHAFKVKTPSFVTEEAVHSAELKDITLDPRFTKNQPLSLKSRSPFEIIKECVSDDLANTLSAYDAWNTGLKNCPELGRVTVSPNIDAVLKDWSFGDGSVSLRFEKEGVFLKEIPIFVIQRGFEADYNFISYINDKVITINVVCAELFNCSYFLLNGEWKEAGDFMKVWLAVDENYKRFYKVLPSLIFDVNVNENYLIFSEGYGYEADEPSYSDIADRERFLQKGRLEFLFDHNLNFVDVGYGKEVNSSGL